MVFQKLLHLVKERHHRVMRDKAAQLDDETRNNLKEFLEDIPQEQEDLLLIQTELDSCHSKLAQLEGKEAFVETRLKAYQAQLKRVEQDPEKRKGASYEKHMQSLKGIEISHQTMQRGIEVLKERINLLETRQLELQQMTEECDVVYKAASMLSVMQLEPETSERFETVQEPPDTNTASSSGTNTTSNSDIAPKVENVTIDVESGKPLTAEQEIEMVEGVVASSEPAVGNKSELNTKKQEKCSNASI